MVLGIIVIIGLWSFIGFMILGVAGGCNPDGMLWNAEGWDFVNPCYVYKHKKVNWFGAIMLSLLYTAICPIFAFGYWFYKLCTFGRR